MQLCVIREDFLKYLAQTSTEPPIYEFVRAEGVYLIDKTGKRYIDMISGIAVNNIGHGCKKIRKAVKKQADQYMHQMVYGEYLLHPQIRLARLLTGLLPENLNSSYFLNSGSEAIEAAIKLSRKYTGRTKVVAMRDAYHGSTTGALSLMSNEYYSGNYKPLLPEVYFADFNEIDSLSIIDEKTAAVFVEPVQAESGYRVANIKFVQALRKKCDETGSLLIFDEIQTGFGRSGRFFAFEQYDTVPDVLCLAKALGGGMPLSALVASSQITSHFSREPILGHITTFGGHPVSCAAAEANIKYLCKHPELISGVSVKETLLREGLQHPKITKITGRGLMLALHLDNFDAVKQVIHYAYREGLLIDWFLYANTALRIAPPLIITEKQIRKVCAVIYKALDNIE